MTGTAVSIRAVNSTLRCATYVALNATAVYAVECATFSGVRASAFRSVLRWYNLELGPHGSAPKGVIATNSDSNPHERFQRGMRRGKLAHSTGGCKDVRGK